MKNSNIFKAKTYNFNSGVNLSINEDKISANDENGISSFDSKFYDNFSYQTNWEGRISPASLWFRFVAVSFVLILITGFIFDNWTATPWIIIGIIVVINILVLFIFMFDAMLQLNAFERIIYHFFSNHYFYVTIGNKSGNNIEFIALLDEEHKLKEIDKCLSNLKLVVETRIEESSSINSLNKRNSSDLDELKKLGELYKNGILTEDEFKAKKQELLKK